MALERDTVIEAARRKIRANGPLVDAFVAWMQDGTSTHECAQELGISDAAFLVMAARGANVLAPMLKAVGQGATVSF